MLKKIFVIIIIILLIVAGIFAYFAFFSKKETPANQDGFSLSDLFPFGDNGIIPKNPDTGTKNPDDNQIPDEPTEPSKPPKLVMVARGPVAGAMAFGVTREKAPDPTKVDTYGNPLPVETEPAVKVRYIEVATGHISETYLDKIEISKITNTTIPKIAEGYFGGKSAVNAILRYADSKDIIQTFAGNIPIMPNKDATPDTNLKGNYLVENITAMAVSPDKEKIITVSKTSTGSIGATSSPDGTKKNQLFALDYSEWAVSWPNIKTVTITTKPSARVPGYSYSIDTTTKTMKKVISGVLGLTTLTSPDTENILFSRSGNSAFTSSIYDIKAKTAFPLPGLNTLPEKCVWQSSTILFCAVPSFVPIGEYPDIWYQGGISFVDQIYKIDIRSLNSAVMANPAIYGASIDAINLSLDPSNSFLIFTNKKDGALWSLDLREDL